MTIRKAVIPAAGFGTRMLPAAKAVPKEMLPILDRPTIQHVVEEAAGAGVDDVLLITSRAKIHSVRQGEQRGLGDAVYQARRHVGDEPFLCLLGDTIFSGDPPPA